MHDVVNKEVRKLIIVSLISAPENVLYDIRCFVGKQSLYDQLPI